MYIGQLVKSFLILSQICVRVSLSGVTNKVGSLIKYCVVLYLLLDPGQC